MGWVQDSEQEWNLFIQPQFAVNFQEQEIHLESILHPWGLEPEVIFCTNTSWDRWGPNAVIGCLRPSLSHLPLL